MLDGGRSQDLPDLLQAGFTIIDIGVPFGWTGPESYDYSGTDSRMEECLGQSDRILMLPRMAAVPGEWWGEQFPDDISRRADNSPVQFKARWHPSFASPRHRQLALSMNHSGHLGLQKVLDCPEIDFVAGPYTYDNRGGGGGNNGQSLPETLARYAKLYFNEADTETHLHQRQWPWGNSLRNPVDFAETKGLLVRDLVYASRRFLAIYSPRGGDRTIQLRRPSRVLDLLEGRVLASKVQSFSLQLQPNGAALLAL